MSSLFYKDIACLKGVGTKRSQLFNRLGVKSIGALLRFYPRAYRDFSTITKLKDIVESDIYCIKATMEGEMKIFTTKTNLLVCRFAISDGSRMAEVTVFNNKFISNIIKPDSEYFFFGKVNIRGERLEMVSPIIRSDNNAKIEPIYSQTKGLNSNCIKTSVKNALKMLPQNMPDTLPEDIREKYNLCSLEFAISNIHFPQSKEALNNARYRLSFEKLLTFYLAMCRLKEISREKNNCILKTDYTTDFLNILPFQLTNAQKKVLSECIFEMKSGKYAMRRLIQGDVGCGKTVVAGGLIFCVVKNNAQAVIMAPTEILAKQHYSYFSELFKNSNINVALLTSSTSTKERREILENTQLGLINLLVGTHSLLSDNLQFSNLALIITDEQQRFGVKQRDKLNQKGKSPHVLLMSATPIPRTLALILFGDYDISIIDELPKGRTKIDTYLINSNQRERAFGFIKKQIDDGGQGYIVCPAIEENDKLIVKSIEEYKRIIAKSCLKDCNYQFLHGKMRDSEKQVIMQDFLQGKIDLIIATTVIEVGIDVPNACIMLIENSERFGFSQLHQLRGRVGRGKRKSYCILLTDNDNEESLKRLQIMCKTNDGFKISAEDLKFRGPGELFGSKQHGELDKELLSGFNDTKTLSDIIKVAEYIINDDIYSEKYRYLRGQIKLELYNKVLI